MSDDLHEIVLRGRGPNTMSLASLGAFQAALDDAAGAPLLLRGEGDAFSAGLDLEALAGVDAGELLEHIEGVARRLFLHPAPTVACVNGHAIAGGGLLAIACDHRVMTTAPSARFGMTAVALGLTYPPMILRLLRHRLPKRSLSRVLLGAARFGSEQALELGVVDELADDPLEVARERLAGLARHPRDAYAATKRALREDAIVVSEEERRSFREHGLSAWEPDAIMARFSELRRS